MKNIQLLGYSDKLSVRPGETVSFKISSTLKKKFTASLKRSISADPNPKGVGIIEEDASKYFKTTSYPSREQTFKPGSYAVSKKPIKISIKKNLTLLVIIFPTLSSSKDQSIITIDNIEIYINSKGSSAIRVGKKSISIKEPLELRSWYKIKVKISINGNASISQKMLKYKDKKPNIKKCTEILPKGSLVVFPGFVWHRVCPVKSGERNSLVIWNLGWPYK